MKLIHLGSVISVGAEAVIYKGYFIDREAVIKKRVRKKYRNPLLDKRIRLLRTRREAIILVRARSIGVPVPILYYLDLSDYTIVMEHIDGELLREIVDEIHDEKLSKLSEQLGKFIGLLHGNKIVHGDLTTSNVMLKDDEGLYLIDFGLGNITYDIEEYATEIHLFKRALKASHPDKFNTIFKSFIRGYRSTYPKADSVLERASTIELRGRYIEKNRRRK
ncbi:Kae1-associated kinase Bud32 [archaeon]|nr:MAG: Kae1-associated kinase Bud32 [archaeon]RLG66096.1 MAG: Kae1-associated kinase Bud32 [archaeon]HDM23926.1 Kae1-associated serine/threonine protein kinase [Candidatus Bathyarchaeota archaeon]